MTLGHQIIIAFLLDLLLGDPPRMPHPVKLIGKLTLFCDRFFRSLPLNERLAGIIAVLCVSGATGLSVIGSLKLAAEVGPLAHAVLSVYFLYTSLAARDLCRHSVRVHRALEDRNMSGARQAVAMIVSRNTETLDEQGISRACVESVAENLVDGVTAPLFYAALGGPLGAMLYKSINTLDSMYGYRNQRYIKFGWFAARLDDFANFIPSRLTSLLIPAAAGLLGFDAAGSLKILRRDRHNHQSPNSGHTEAAFAGALSVQLGGLSWHSGEAVAKPLLGDPVIPVAPNHIIKANVLMLTTAAFALIIILLLRQLTALFL